MICLVCPEKTDTNCTCIIIVGDRICYPGNVGTNTASLYLVKLVLNSILSRKAAKYVTFEISNFYLQTSLDRPKYVRIKLYDITQDFIGEYNLLDFVQDGWVYFEINRGVYVLPHSGILANKILKELLAKYGYYQCATATGLWRHKWRPILFSLIVDDFGVEYIGDRHTYHL